MVALTNVSQICAPMSPDENKRECSPGNSIKKPHMHHKQDCGCCAFPKALEPRCLSASSSALQEVEVVFGCSSHQRPYPTPYTSVWWSFQCLVQTVHSLVYVLCFTIQMLSQAHSPTFMATSLVPDMFVCLDSVSVLHPVFSHLPWSAPLSYSKIIDALWIF